jgi:hypothetical protein
MTWNFRIIKHVDDTFHVHEVYYDEDGKPDGVTESPSAPFGETLEEICNELKNMQNAKFLDPLDMKMFLDMEEDHDYPEE